MPVDLSNVEITTADIVKAACVTALQNSTALQALGIQVDYGPPAETRPPEGLYLGDIHWDETDWASLGAPDLNAHEERYTIDLVIGARTDGYDQQAATERGYNILRLANRELAAAAIVPLPGWLLIKPNRSIEGQVEQASAANVNAGIHVYAYLP